MNDKLHEALVRRRGTEECRHVTDSGLNYCAPYRDVLLRVHQMAQAFPHNEYRIREVQHA